LHIIALIAISQQKKQV